MAITRNDGEALINEQVVNEIQTAIVQKSAILQNARKLPNMTSNVTKMSVLDALPVGGFVSGDTGLKTTSNVEWKNVYINAEEIAVIIPIAEAVLDDADYDIFEQIKPLVIENFGKIIDAAIISGTDAPQSWGAGLINRIRNSGNTVAYNGTDTLYEQIDAAMAKVEANGFTPTVVLGGVGLKSGFRNMTDTTGQPIKGTEIDSITKVTVSNGAWGSDNAKFIVGDFSNLVYAIRQDMTFKVLDQSCITDSDGKVLYNLAQQDMVAIRCVMRLGWAVPNPVTSINSNRATSYPFALAEPDASLPTVQTVTFTVTDPDSANVEGATVTVGGITKVTNSSGVATADLAAGTYNYTVKSSTVKTKHGTVTVASSGVSVAVTNFA
jgi:HK97 family phage major capsid protein